MAAEVPYVRQPELLLHSEFEQRLFQRLRFLHVGRSLRRRGSDHSEKFMRG